MSWADEHAIQSIEDGAAQVRESLETGIHIDANGNKIDVSKIDSRYANNLYSWYLRKFSKEMHEEVLNSRLFEILKGKIN